MIVTRDVDVEDMEVIRLTQVVGEIDEAGRGSFRDSVIDHDDVLVEIISIFGSSCIE